MMMIKCWRCLHVAPLYEENIDGEKFCERCIEGEEYEEGRP